MILLDVKNNHFKQHLPGWADFDRIEFDFMGQEQLLTHEVINRWKKDKDFHRFSLSENNNPYSEKYSLMVELNEGRRWWVVGYLRHTDEIDLPTWEPVRA